MKLSSSKITRYLTLLVILLGTSISAFAQQIKVTGTVKDPEGEPLIGVSVRVQKTGTGAVTDMDGNFSVEVPSKSTLTFSYIGYESQDVAVNGRSVINVTLKEKNDLMNEVVVIGYGTMDKKELTSEIGRAHV